MQGSQICIWIKINICFGNSDKKQIVVHNLVFFSFCICDCFAVSGWEQGSYSLQLFKAFYLLFCFVLFSLFFPTMGLSRCKPSSQETCHHFPILTFWHSPQRAAAHFTSCPCVQPAKSSCLWGRNLCLLGRSLCSGSCMGRCMRVLQWHPIHHHDSSPVKWGTTLAVSWAGEEPRH